MDRAGVQHMLFVSTLLMMMSAALFSCNYHIDLVHQHRLLAMRENQVTLGLL